MRIKQTLIFSFAGGILLVGIVGAFSFLLSNQIQGLRNTELPMEQNLSEVEVNIWETIHSADSFKLSGNELYKELYEQQKTEVEEYLSKYADLTDTKAETEFLEEFWQLWKSATAAGDKMVELSERQKAAEDAFFVNVDEADDVIDFEIQGKWKPTDPNILQKEQYVREVEVSIWEAIHAGQQFTGLAGDIIRGKQKYVGSAREAAERGAKASLVKGDFADLMERQFEDVEEYWTKYKALPLESFEKEAIKEFEGYWEKAVEAGREVVLLHGQAEEQFNILFAKIDQADDVIDFKMQEFIKTRIDIEDEKAKQVRTATMIISIFAFSCIVVIGVFASHSICRPIAKLRDSVVEIGEGNLEVRADTSAKNEIGVLAAAFNKTAYNLKKSIDALNWEIAERKKAEQKQVELLKQLENVNKELKDFAYIVSHDLKAPLRGIKTLAGWMLSDYADKLDEDGREQLKLLSSRVDRMQGLIDGILQYSRIGRLEEEERVEVDLNRLITDIIDMLAPPENITITVENELPIIECEQTRITQVFQNLISNAIKYMDKPEGLVKVGCIEEDGYWKFSISDNGPGIEEKYFDKIFQMFQTLSPRDEYESTGIGLTVVKRIIELYGGRIWVESKIGEGSTFYLTLPVKETVVNHDQLQSNIIN